LIALIVLAVAGGGIGVVAYLRSRRPQQADDPGNQTADRDDN
jgi:cbb3-type cytochrome oxidase maturation protein